MSENSQTNCLKSVRLFGMKRFEIYHRAVRDKDPRFDGKFFFGVKTTGIYCRPICPAKPLRRNIEFFSSKRAAEAAGYRACKRCRPEASPNSAAWLGTSAVVRRALKTLHSTQCLEFNEDQFADKFGVSARHLRRLFVDEVGKTPKQLALQNRLAAALKLVIQTKLSMPEIADRSGFKSIRRFNDAFKDQFHKAPTQIRKDGV